MFFVPKSEEFVSLENFTSVSLPLRTAAWSHECRILLRFACPSRVLMMDSAALESMCSRIGTAVSRSLAIA